MNSIQVILLGEAVGSLTQSRDGRISFQYSEDWLNQDGARPLSQSLPLRREKFSEKACAPFFGGLLPEEHNREIIAKNLGITPRNDYAMLREIGGECAGAVSLLPHTEDPAPSSHRYQPITEAELITVLDQLPRQPLLAGQAEIRLSLAGAQNKIALKLDDAGYSLPLHEAPSTHILKPELDRFPGLAQNEAYSLKLAAACGLNTCQAEEKTIGAHRCLLVTRYDRTLQAKKIHRLHQEDFCQALAIPSRTKYQSEGGPGLSQCFELLRRASTSPAKDLLQLFHGVLFNYLIGNHHAHGKNFSLLYSPSTEAFTLRLAPFYDLISTAIYPELTTRMAMKIGKHYQPDDLRLQDWELYWRSIGFSNNQARKQTQQFADQLLENLHPPENQTQEAIQSTIRERANTLRKSLRV